MRRIAFSDLIGIVLAVAAWIAVGLISILAVRAVMLHH
jgi:hypothetical protein